MASSAVSLNWVRYTVIFQSGQHEVEYCTGLCTLLASLIFFLIIINAKMQVLIDVLLPKEPGTALRAAPLRYMLHFH